MNLKSDARTMQVLLGVLLLACTGWLASRSVGAVDEVMAVRPLTTRPVKADEGRFDAVARRMEQRRARVAAADAVRDPFRLPPAPKAAALSTPAPVVRREQPLPRLQAVVFDDLKPAVRLLVGDAGSDWIGVGERFQGWTVLEIRPGKVRVGDGARQFELGLN